MASIQGIYLALFGRPADPAGLAYFNKVTNNGSDLSKIGDLAETAEYKSRFAGKSNDEIVNSIYKSLFGRDAEPEGLAFFSNGLKNGTFTINNIAISILDGAQGSDKTTIDGKVAAADIFTSHLDLSIEIAAYNGNSAAQLGRDYISSITNANPGTGENADAAILKIVALAGQAPAGDAIDAGGGGGFSGETSYAAGDVLLLKNSAVKGTYDYAKFTPVETFSEVSSTATLREFSGALNAAMNDAAPGSESPVGNTVLVQNLSPVLDAYGKELKSVAGFVGQLIPSYTEWMPKNLFIGIPGQSSTVTGTSGNDVALIINGNQFDHTVTGGRGNDVLVVAGINGFPLPSDNYTKLMTSETTAKPAGPMLAPLEDSTSKAFTMDVKIGVHKIDGGDGDDIIVNIGGDHNQLLGGSGQDIIVSLGDARDTINGGAGNDFIFGGSDGNPVKMVPAVAAISEEAPVFAMPDFKNGDVLTGGAGNDTFLYLPEGRIAGSSIPFIGGALGNITSNGADTITDFTTTQDKIGIFVETGTTIKYKEGDGFASFDAAAKAAVTSFQPAPEVSVERTASASTINAFFAANVGGNGYLFIDDNNDQNIDFVIKLQGLTSLNAFEASDINAIDVSSILSTVGSVLPNTNMFAMAG